MLRLSFYMEGGDTGWLKQIQTVKGIIFLELGEPIKMAIVFTRKPMVNELLKFGFPITKNQPD